MINVKDEVYSALCSVSGSLSVSDTYPTDWSKDYTVQYVEEDNSVYEVTDDVEQLSRLRYAIYAWSNGSLSQLALDIDAKLSAIGLKRTLCQDVADPSGRRHKVMRYEGIIDCTSEHVYWNNNR